MRILVTGGSGFIGTHLCRALVESGHETRVLDRVGRPAHPVNGVDYRLGDVNDPDALKNAIAGMDSVFHFAARVSVPACQEKPVESHEDNLMATARVLEAIRSRSDRSVRLIFSSSAAVYSAISQPRALREEETSSNPLSFYGAQKLGSEHLVRLYHRFFGIPGVTFRFFNVYGPGQDPSSPYSGVISVFRSRVLQGLPVRIFGGGSQTRDFVSVHDIVRACLKALEIPEAQCNGEPTNLGSGVSTSIHDLAKEMISLSGRSSNVEIAPERPGDLPHSLADIQLARKVLGWEPSVRLRDGLSELLRS